MLPAIRRYISPRIRSVHRLSRRAGARLAILSGEFGLIGPWKRIPHYNHLLRANELPELLPQMVGYLKKKGFRSVTFFHAPLRSNPKIKPYLLAIRQACRAAELPLTLIELNMEDPVKRGYAHEI
jgi:hypothetical protein